MTAKANDASKGVGAVDNTGTKTSTGSKRVGPGAAEKQTGQGVDNTTNMTPGAGQSATATAPQPALENGPGAPGFVTPAVGGMDSASFSAGGTPVTPVVGTISPVVQDDDVPAGQSPVGEEAKEKAAKKPVHSDSSKPVTNSKKHK